MRFKGRLQRDGKWWLAEVPVFDAMTQGRTRREALAMIADWFESMIDKRNFHVQVHDGGRGDEFEIGSEDLRTLIALLLQRQRQRSGLSLKQAANRLGSTSRNAYARYERGDSVPSIEKLDQLLRAIAIDREIVLNEAVA